MEVLMQSFQLSSLVAQLNTEIQDQVIHCLATANSDCVVGWNSIGEETRLDVHNETKLVVIRSIVLPVTSLSTGRSLALSGAQIEVVGACRLTSDRSWLRNHEFGEGGSLIYTLASFEPDDIKTTASTIADVIGKYLDAQLETC